jgi:hypothetical protein
MIIAETNLTTPTGPYWKDLKKLGLPFYIYYRDELVIVKFKEYKKVKGKGCNKQYYYHLEDGRVKHCSLFKKCDVMQLNREYKLSKLFD